MNKILLIIGSVLLFLTILIGGSFYAVQQSIFTREAWYPEFGRIKCDPYPFEDSAQVTIPSGSTKTFICGEHAYVPEGRSCTYFVKQKFGGSVFAKQCNADGTNCKDANEGFGLIQETADYIVPAGKMLQINPKIRDGILIKQTATSYRLHTIDSGFESVDVKDCKIVGVSKLPNDPQNVGVKTAVNPVTREVNLAPDAIYHYISRLTNSISANSITSSEFNNGQPIYVHRLGAYYPIVQAKDGKFAGKLVADTEHEVIDARVKCFPASDFCDSNTLHPINIENKKCSDTLGRIGQYAPTTTPNKICKTECNTKTGNVQYTTDCKTLKICSGNTPNRDPQTLECVSGGQLSNKQQQCALTGGIWIEKQTQTCAGSILCELGITNKDISNESFCKQQDYWQYIIIAGVVILALILITQPKKVVPEQIQ